MKNPDWKKELSGIPSMACVAFAARCARRVQPLFLISWPQAPERLYHLLDGAVATVEESSLGIDRKNSTFAFNGMSAVKAATKAEAHQAAAVAGAIAFATHTLAAVGYGDLSVTHAAQAADYAHKVFDFGSGSERREAMDKVLQAMHEDLERIRGGLERGDVADNSTIPLDFFGPLWPDGEPRAVIQMPRLEAQD